MKPLRFAFGEYSDLDPPRRHAFDHLYLPPQQNFQFQLTARLPKDDYTDIITFQNGPLLKAVGNFVVNINAAFDKSNQIGIHIPDPTGRSLFVMGNNIIALHHVKDSIEDILDAYAINIRNKSCDESFDPRQMVKPSVNRTRRFMDCFTAFNSIERPVSIYKLETPATTVPAETIIDRFLKGYDIDRLTHPDIAYDSFDLDHGHIELRPSEFDTSEANNCNSNMLHFDDEKKESPESIAAFRKHWDIRFFESGKAEYFKRLKTFLQSELSVTVSISDYSPSRVELHGEKENVLLAKRIGIRAVPLLIAGEPLRDKKGKLGKPLDKEWLENALSDARNHFALQRICEKLGIEINKGDHRAPKRKSEPKDYADFRFS